MIDSRILLTDFETAARKLARKGVDRAMLVEVRDLLEQRRVLLQRLEPKRASMNKASKEIGRLLASAKREEAEAAKASVASLKSDIETDESLARNLQIQIDDILLRLPNFPDDNAPDGAGEADNKVLRIYNYKEEVFRNRSFRPHWELGTELGIYDPDRAAKISGSMFALFRGDGAKLLRALVKFGLDLNVEKYEEILPPHFVRTETFTATGHLPKFEMEAYKLRDDDLWAIPTGEVPLMSLHRDEILREEELPKRYITYTVCFRREAGAAGKDTRGLQRLHEFHKVELLKLCTPQQVQAEFEDMLADAERPLQILGLPYRVVDLCSADLTFSSSRIFDLEVYTPGADRWLEVSSVGIFTDFQARRANIRYRPSSGGKPEFVYALNGSGLATPRVWAAIVEHGQQADGTLRVPEALVPFMGKEFIGK